MQNKGIFKNENFFFISEFMQKNVIDILLNQNLIVNYLMSKTNLVNKKDL